MVVCCHNPCAWGPGGVDGGPHSPSRSWMLRDGHRGRWRRAQKQYDTWLAQPNANAISCASEASFSIEKFVQSNRRSAPVPRTIRHRRETSSLGATQRESSPGRLIGDRGGQHPAPTKPFQTSLVPSGPSATTVTAAEAAHAAAAVTNAAAAPHQSRDVAAGISKAALSMASCAKALAEASLVEEQAATATMQSHTNLVVSGAFQSQLSNRELLAHRLLERERMAAAAEEWFPQARWSANRRRSGSAPDRRAAQCSPRASGPPEGCRDQPPSTMIIRLM